MPTPFMHLDFAERILARPALPESIAERLRANWAAFYLGSIAADYQSITDTPRESTHFYPIPLLPEHNPVTRLLDENPGLANSAEIAPDLAIFTVAYLAHLYCDVVWYRHIMLPYFAFNKQWDDVDRRERFMAHNILLTWLDQRALGRLPDSAEKTLSAATVPQDIPFLDPDGSTKWHQLIVDQLAPGAMSSTVQIYAERLNTTPEAFAAQLNNDEWMQSILFNRVPLYTVLEILDGALDTCVDLITAYLTNNDLSGIL